MRSQGPTKQQLLAAQGRRLPDVIAPGLRVLFCGINPGLYSAAVGHHFARPGNRFWSTLHLSGFTPRLLAPAEACLLVAWGCGLTDLVARATAAAQELERAELVAGRRRLERKVRRFGPTWVAILGIGAYRVAFGRPAASVGLQPGAFGGARIWVLPNPSGLNAHHQRPALVRAFRKLRAASSTAPVLTH
jgi:TDG/mug DNA glycosylase family protein